MIMSGQNNAESINRKGSVEDEVKDEVKDRDQILAETFGKIDSYLRENERGSAPVVKYRTPGELAEVFAIPVQDQGTSESEFMGLIAQYLDYSVHTGNKLFLNQLYSGFNFPAFIGDVLTSLTNTSMYTYEVAPVATMIEKEMIRLMNAYVGYTAGDGIFLSGGSNANLMAMFSARNRILPESRFEGNGDNRLKAFVSDQAHYSFDTAANLIGIGSKNLVKIKSDKNGRMIPAELQKALATSIANNEIPFFVGATCATTLLGAFDPLDELAEICQNYGMWLHADGSFGGTVVLSEKYRHLIRGIEKTDSFGWTAHKLMNIPLICSALLVKQGGTLQHNLSDINTDYIYHDSDETEDLGKKSIQCGRHVDAVKLWFAWKYYGKEAYGKRIENLIELAEYAEKTVINNRHFELLAPRQSFTVCFRYVPLEGTDLNVFNLSLRESLRRSGRLALNYGYIDHQVVLRLVITNGEMEKADVDLFFLHVLEEGLCMENQGVLANVEAN